MYFVRHQTITNDDVILIIGSQAILASHDADALPLEATRSIEADLAFFDDPDEKKSDLIDGLIGEGPPFHEEFSYYAQGVGTETAILPKGWQERLVLFSRGESSARCLEPHDLVVAKLVAGREKDYEFAQALLLAGLVDTQILQARAELLPTPGAVVRRIQATIRRLSKNT